MSSKINMIDRIFVSGYFREAIIGIRDNHDKAQLVRYGFHHPGMHNRASIGVRMGPRFISSAFLSFSANSLRPFWSEALKLILGQLFSRNSTELDEDAFLFSK
jgi:hypothetical protein